MGNSSGFSLEINLALFAHVYSKGSKASKQLNLGDPLRCVQRPLLGGGLPLWPGHSSKALRLSLQVYLFLSQKNTLEPLALSVAGALK